MKGALVVRRVKDAGFSLGGCQYGGQQASRLREAVLHSLPRAIARATIERRLRALWIVRLLGAMRGRDHERRGIGGICRPAPEVGGLKPFRRPVPGLTRIFALDTTRARGHETVSRPASEPGVWQPVQHHRLG